MAIIGIDLGTTYSAMATMEGGIVREIINREGKPITPSVVFFPDDELPNAIVGETAVFSAGTAPERTVRFIKRQMGTDFQMAIGGKKFKPEEISSAILTKLKVDAEEFFGEPVTAAVITVPAYFEAAEREATKKAAELAGLTVLTLLAEPVAAAIDFAQSKGENLADKTVLVYDLGGGTFDVTVMRVAKPDPSGPLQVEVVGKDGSRTLGGADWDSALARHVSDEFERQHPGQKPEDDPKSFDILMLRCEEAKKTLASLDQATVLCSFDNVNHTVTVSRSQFEQMTEGLLQETADKTFQLVAGLEAKTKGESRPIRWDTIDYILLAGGSTKMPVVSAMLEKISGKKPVTNRGVDMNVARGAAFVAFMQDAWTTTEYRPTAAEEVRIKKSEPKTSGVRISVPDIANHSIGVIAHDSLVQRDMNDILIKKDSKLPTQMARPQVYQTMRDRQTIVEIPITRGESDDPNQVETLGVIRLTDIPPGPAGQEIEVFLSYSPDGLITGRAKHLGSGKNIDIKVSVNPRRTGE